MTEAEARAALDEVIAELQQDWTRTGNPVFVFEAIYASVLRARPTLLNITFERADVEAALAETRFPDWVMRYLWDAALALSVIANRLPRAKRATPKTVAERLPYLLNFVDPGRNAFAEYVREREEAKLLRDFERLRDELGTAQAAYSALLQRGRYGDERALRRALARARKRRGDRPPA